MRGKSVALLVLALGCGLVASIGITQVMAKRNAPEATPVGETENILVAIQDIPFNESIEASMLRLEKWPKDKVPSGAITKMEEVEGRRTRTTLFAGEPLLEGKLTSGDEGGVGMLIPKGWRVVPVRVDTASGGGGLVRPGDRVDVLVHLARNPTRGITKTTTKTILQDVKVFAVNADVGDKEDDKGKSAAVSAKTISLLLTPEDSERAMLASQLGKVQLILRSPDEDTVGTVGDGDGTDPNELFGISGHGDREKEDPQAKPADAQAKDGNELLDFLRQFRQNGSGTDSTPATPASKSDDSQEFAMTIYQGQEPVEVILEESPNAKGTRRWKVKDGAAGPASAPAAVTPPMALPGNKFDTPTHQGTDDQPSPEDKPVDNNNDDDWTSSSDDG